MVKQFWKKISGCYVPIPTLFREGDLKLNLPGMRRHVQFSLMVESAKGNQRSWLPGEREIFRP